MFPGLAPQAEVRVDEYDETTASATPAFRADGVADLVAQCPEGFGRGRGVRDDHDEVAVANTEGQFCWSPSTMASINTVVSGGEGGHGFAEVFESATSDVDPVAIGKRAASRRRLAVAEDIEKGGIRRRARGGFDARGGSLSRGSGSAGGRSPRGARASRAGGAAGGRGRRLDLRRREGARGTLGLPFDFEGVPRSRVDLIKDGTFLGGVYDLRTAKQAGVRTTGHALPPPNPEGPFPLNLFMEPGEASVEEMIARIERGLLVTRFHYTNVVHPIESTITGMTRDGTFLIENGEIAHPVKNLRFTQSIVEALTGTEMIGRDTELASEFFFSASRVPALKVASFNWRPVGPLGRGSPVRSRSGHIHYVELGSTMWNTSSGLSARLDCPGSPTHRG